MNSIFIILSTLLIAVFGLLRYALSYWDRRGVKQLKNTFLFRHFFKLQSLHLSELFEEVYDEFKGKTLVAGSYIYTRPIAIALDLDFVKQILIKDFNKFVDRSEYRNAGEDPLSGNLFHLDGDKWRSLRVKLSPTFTSGKMKFMFPLIVEIAKEFEEAFNEHLLHTKDRTVEVNDFIARYTTDVIGQCAFGIECNSLKNPNVEFRQIGRYLVDNKFLSIRWRILVSNYLNIFKYFGTKRFNDTIYHFVSRVLNDTINAREKYGIKRNDFLDILLDLKNTKDADGKPTLDFPQMAAQVFVFFRAGFETTSSNMTYCLFEIAKNPHIQEKLRNEIFTVLEKHNNNLTYEAMIEMTYLDQVITETLRKYPELSIIHRVAMEEYKIPGTDIVLEKDTRVYIPVKAIHHDPNIYDQPEEFRPERFDPEEVCKRHPQSFLGFGDGPRNCIGSRFGRMQVSVGIIALLKSFRFSVSSKTCDKLKISARSFISAPAHAIWLRAHKL